MADAAPVHVVGSINTDLVAYVERLPAPGETLFGERFAQFAGGKGANQAVAAARAGAAVSFHGAVGDDAFGHAGRAGLRQDGIAVDGLLTLPEHASGIALILVDRTGRERDHRGVRRQRAVCPRAGGGDPPAVPPAQPASVAPVTAAAKRNRAGHHARLRAPLARRRRPRECGIIAPAPATAPLPAAALAAAEFLLVNEGETCGTGPAPRRQPRRSRSPAT